MKTPKKTCRSTVFIFLFFCGIPVFWGFQVSGEDWTNEQKEVWKSVEAS